MLLFRKGLAIKMIDDYTITIKRGNSKESEFNRYKDDIFTSLDDFIECSINEYLLKENR